MVSQVRQTSSQDSTFSVPVRLLTLGTLELEGTSGDLPPGLASGRPLALLAYLALRNGRGATRDDLADLLWEGRDMKAGRRVLRQALYVIRKGLGAGSLETTTDSVRLTEVLATDAQEFETAVRAGDHRSAFDLYRGPFLDGFELSSASRFSAWVDGERSRLHGMFLEAALALADEASDDGDAGFALECLERILEFDPEHPHVRLRRMEALDACGRSVEAGAAAHDVKAWFEREREPMPAWARTTVQRLTAARGPSDVVADGENGLRQPAFSGRGAEYRVLLKQWQSVVAGEGKIVLVVGDPGIGKTRLIEELLWVAELEGGRVLKGKSYQLEDGLLFGSLVDVMAQAITAPGFAAVNDVWLAELARLLPELVEQYPELQVSSPQSGAGRRRLHEAVAQVLDALAYEAPVVCVLDDLHWADDATLELVHYLARRLCASPVLIVAGLRPGEASETLRRLQHVLETEHGGVTIALPPLSRESVSDILTSMAHDHRPPASIEEGVWEASAGNPFLAVSMLRALVEMGSVRVGESGWEPASSTAGSAEPIEADLLLWSLVAGLPERSLRLLELAAIVGRTFTAEQLATASGEELESVTIRLDALAKRRILKSMRSEGVTRFDFIHDRMRQVVYEAIPSDMLAALHGRVARSADGDLGLNACILARHFHQAGQREDAYRHALIGAEWAQSVFAYGGEMEMLELALANAPDEEVEEALRARLDAVARRQESRRPDPTNPGLGSRRLRAWLKPAAAAAALAVVASTTWIAGTALRGAFQPPELLPLPPGLIVQVEGREWSGFAVLDPMAPGREPTRFSARELSLPAEITGNFELSPDGSWLAFTVATGEAPDVWLQRRDGEFKRRLTFDAEDDEVMDWAPDRSSVLIRTLRGRSGVGYGAGIAVMPLDGSPARVLTHGPWDDGDARFSPSGARIAFVRNLDGASIWLMNTDGSDRVELIGGRASVTRLEWAPDGSTLAFSEVSDAGMRVSLLDIAGGKTRILADGNIARFVWSPDGSELYAAMVIDGNSEIVAISISGGDVRRITYSAADETPIAVSGLPRAFISAVEILVTTGVELTLLEGDTLDVAVFTWSSDDRLVEDAVPTVRCADASICEVVDELRIRGTRPGETYLIAGFGGWRADTVPVRVVSATPVLLFEEDWEGGIDPSKWIVFGDPWPETIEGIGRGGTRGFVNNGDAKYSSGVVSAAPVDLRDGLTIEFWARGEFGTAWPSHQSFHASILAHGLVAPTGDVGLPVLIDFEVGRIGRNGPIALNFQGAFLAESAQWSPSEWHQYGLQILPGGRCELWIDGQKYFTRACMSLPSDTVYVELGGRASHAPMVHDDVKVWRGPRWR